MTVHTEREVCPYVGLQPFEADDRDYFFGRERDQRIIISNLLSSPLTILYGSSGVGKSSVLLAGVIPQLRKERPKTPVVVFRDWGDPNFQQALVRACINAVWSGDTDQPKPAETLPFDEIIRACAEAAHETVLIILDQFEEYFLYHAKSTDPTSFEAQFARAVNRENVNVGFLIAMRDDSLSKLDRFQERIHNLLSNRIRLNHLDATGATQAIVQPLKVWNARQPDGQPAMEIEPALVEALLDQVQTGKVQVARHGGAGTGQTEEIRIEAPFLQLVMVRLWEEERRSGSNALQRATLDRLKGANEIVHNHLDETMSRLDPRSQAVCARFFDRLVTPSGAKIACSTSDLTCWAGDLDAHVPAVLAELTKSGNRILRPVTSPDDPETKRFEIFHDVLAPAILDWRRRFVANETRAEEIQQARKEAATRSLHQWLAAMGTMTCIAIAGWLYASWEGRLSEANQKAAESISVLPSDASRALDLALESVEHRVPLKLSPVLAARFGLSPSPAAEDALRQAIQGQTTRLEWTLKAGERIVSDLAFSPDGKLLAVADREHKITIWPLDGTRPNQPQATLNHEEWVRRVIFLPDSRTLVSVAGDNAYLWSLDKPEKPLRTFPQGSKIFSALDISRDGRLLATAGKGDDSGEGRVIKIWSIDGNEPIARPKATYNTNGAWLMSIGFSPDGCCIATSAVLTRSVGKAHMATIRSVAGGEPLELPLEEATDAIKFTPDGKSLITGSRDSWVRVWQPVGETLPEMLGRLAAGGGKPIIASWSTRILAGHGDRVRGIDASQDGTRLASGSGDFTAKVWDAETGENILTLSGHSNYVEAARFHPDGHHVATASRDGTVKYWNIDGHANSINSLAFNPQGTLLVTASADRTARVWDVSSDTPRQRYLLTGHGDQVYRAAFDSTGKLLATAGLDKQLILWDVDTGQEIRRIQKHVDQLRDVAFSPGGRRMASGGADGKAWLYELPATDLATADIPAIMVSHSDGGEQISALAFHPTREQWATSGYDGKLRLWDFTGQSLGTIAMPEKLRSRGIRLADIAFSPDGRRVATVVGHHVMLWPIDAFTQPQEPVVATIAEGSRAFCSALKFTADSEQLAVACSDGGVRLLDSDNLAVEKTITVHNNAVNDIDFTRDGRRLATACRDKTFHVSPLGLSDLYEAALLLRANHRQEPAHVNDQ